MALTIGQVAKTSGIAAKTIRFYEAAGVLPVPGRTASGYRQYTAEDVQQLRFVGRARVLGLSVRDLKRLTVAPDDRGRRPRRVRVREVVRARLSTVQARIRELRLLERELAQVLRRIDGAVVNGSAADCRCLEPARNGGAIAHAARRR
jgi:MerR family transcriptional regulator, copper efflux regulator